MIEIMLVCLLAAGESMRPPPSDWVITNIQGAGGRWSDCAIVGGCPPVRLPSAKITIRKSVKPGGIVTLPEGCRIGDNADVQMGPTGPTSGSIILR